MRFCQCGNTIPYSKIIDGKVRRFQNRTKCLSCLPFNQSIYRKKSPEEKRSQNALKAREWYQRKRAELGADPISILRNKRRSFVIDIVGGACQFCGYNKWIQNLSFHHLFDKDRKLDNRSFQYALPKLAKELHKCVLACHNCHGEIHAGLIPPEKVAAKHKEACLAFDTLVGKNWAEIMGYNHSPQTKICAQCSAEFVGNMFCSPECYRKSREVIVWPTDDELLLLSAEFGKAGLGRKLGVSDKAIAKRLKRILVPNRNFHSG